MHLQVVVARLLFMSVLICLFTHVVPLNSNIWFRHFYALLILYNLSEQRQSRWRPSSGCSLYCLYPANITLWIWGMVCNLWSRHRRRLTRLIKTGASGESFIVIGRILTQMMRFGLAVDNHSCLRLSVDVACLSSNISVVPIPVKIIPELFSRAF